MRVRFWGVRGSIPCPGPDTIKYGGNTACIELRAGRSERLIIIDAGSGIRQLGNAIMAQDYARGPVQTEIFLTHTHWDHIMGFPFFAPIYVPGTRLKIYGPVTYEDEPLEEIVGGQLTYRYFPVRLAELAADIRYVSLREEHLELGEGISVTTKYLNHPVLCLGYRFRLDGKIFCTVYDTEPFRNLFVTDSSDPNYDAAMAEEGEKVAREENQRIEDFFAGADLVVHDVQYTTEEYENSKIGWGHSPIDFAVAAANRAGVKRLALFHHEPARTDAQIDALAERYCRPRPGHSTQVFFAREGMVVDL